MKKIYISMIMLWLFIMVGINTNTLETKAAKPTSGKDAYGNTWVYDKASKTLTISGTGKAGDDISLNTHSVKSPEWSVWCDEAKHVVVNEGITELETRYMVSMYRVEDVKLPSTLEKIGEDVFYNCWSLKEVEIPAATREIGYSAFFGCKGLKNVILKDGLRIIGDSAFESTAIKELDIPDSVTKIGHSAFLGCEKLVKIKLPSKLKKISPQTFDCCKNLQTIEIPKSVTSIGILAFSGTGIREITIPKNVTKLYREKSDYADKTYNGIFTDCKKLRKVTIQSKKLKKLCQYSLCKTGKKVVIKVPKSKLKKYRKMFWKAGLSKKVKVRGR